MPNFKPKTNKAIDIDEKSVVTVDSKHNHLLKKFEKEEALLKELKDTKVTIKHRLKTKDYASVDVEIELKDQLYDINKQIKLLKSNKKNYLLDNSKYVFDYFENKKNIIQNNNKKKKLDQFFKIKDSTTNDESVEFNNSKKYLINVDDDFIDINDYIETHDTCDCGGELILVEHEGNCICNRCGVRQQYLVEHDKPSYKEPPKEICFYAYKRINHFREILAQFQAKETTQIEDEVMENIKKQIKKERIPLEKLTNKKTKQILKNLGYNKYYEHIPFIKNKLGIKPPTMSIDLENKLCNLFLEIQKPYAKFCPNDRVNFLNYYYTIYKLCELLGEDEYLPHFSMLKDSVKRMEQDEIWKKICEELNWEFIPTP
jgi:hypothetical protein